MPPHPMAPRRAGALDAAAGPGSGSDRLATGPSPRRVDASDAVVESHAVPPPPVSSGNHSAAWLAERHPALFRLHSEVLSSLPALSQQEGNANAVITGAIEAALRDLPPQDSRRLELVRTASYFLNNADRASFAKAKEALSRAAIGGPDAGTASIEQMDDAWGSSAERRDALMHTLPQWLAHGDDHSFGPLRDRLSAQLVDGGDPLREQARRFMAAAGDREDNGLPGGHDWLRQPRDVLARSRQRLVVEGGCNRLLLSQLTALAADLPALKGNRHHLVRFIRELLRGARRHDEPAVASSDLRALLQALVRQLPHPEFGSGLTQNDILELVGEQLAGEAMRPGDRSQVLATLLPLIGSLSASRFSGARDVQGEAIQRVSSALGHLSAQHCAPLLHQMLDLSGDWSTKRRSAHGKYVPHTRKQVHEVITAQAIGIPMTMGESAITAATRWVAGRRSVLHKATQTIGATLGDLMTVGAPAGTAQALLPVCHRVLLQGEDPGAGGKRKLRNQILASLARGGLPFGGSAAQRESFIAQGLGRDPALRTAAAHWLTKASLGKDAESDSTTRVAAARYLHHLLESGGHTLSDQETQAARQAVLRAFRTTAGNLQATAVMAALLGEIQWAGAVQGGAGTAGSANETLVGVLSSGVMKCFSQIGPHEAARVVPHIVSAYGGMSDGHRAQVDTQVLRRLSGPIAVDGPAAQPQLPGLGLIGSLSRYSANDPAQMLRLADEVWRRLNRTNQQAALQQLFDDVDSASPAGLATAIRFVARRSDDGDFVSAAVPMVRQMLAGPEAAHSLDSGARTLAVEALCERLPRLAPARASELIANAVDGATHLPATLWHSFIDNAARLDAPALRGLLTAWCNSLPTQTPQEAGQLRDAWQKVLPRLEASAAGTVNAFMHLAAESAPRLQLPKPRRPVSPAAAGELASALPRMDVASMQAALQHIRQAELPGALRNEVTRNVLEQYPRIQAELRPTALALCFSTDPVRTLHALAERAGRRELLAGKVLWSSLEQALPLAAGGQTNLMRELLQRPAGEVLPALEALAERYAAPMPRVHHEAIALVLAKRLPDLSPPQHQRVIDTLVLANPELGDEQIRGLGGNPADAAWAAPRQTPPEQMQERLLKLRESRWREGGAGYRES